MALEFSGSVDLGPEGNKSDIGAISGYILLCLVSKERLPHRHLCRPP